MRQLRYSLALCAFALPGCFYPADRGRALEAKVSRLEADNAALATELKDARAKLEATLPRIDAKVAEVTKALEALDTASRRSGADIGVQLSKAVEDLAASVRALAGEADLQVRGGRSGFPERLFPQVARVPGVSWVNPVLELDAGIAGTERTLRVIGVDALRVGRPELLAPDKVLLSPMAAAELGEGRLPLVVGERVVELETGGVTELKGFAALTDVSTAQWRLGRLGELNRDLAEMFAVSDP